MSAEMHSEPTTDSPEDELMGSSGETYRDGNFIKKEKELFLSSTPAEKQMLDSFYGYCEAHDTDFHANTVEGRQFITEAAHNFIADAVDRKISKERSEQPDETPYVVDAPRAQIKKIYDKYYSEFGAISRTGKGPLKDKKLDFLHDGLNFAATYDITGNNKVSRRSRKPRYPAVDLALKLEDVLRDAGVVEAADSVEVLIAAYGHRFDRLVKNIGSTVYENYTDYPSSIVNRFDIPNEQEAEDKIIY